MIQASPAGRTALALGIDPPVKPECPLLHGYDQQPGTLAACRRCVGRRGTSPAPAVNDGLPQSRAGPLQRMTSPSTLVGDLLIGMPSRRTR